MEEKYLKNNGTELNLSAYDILSLSSEELNALNRKVLYNIQRGNR